MAELFAQMNVRLPADVAPQVEARLEELKRETRLSKGRVIALVLAGATRETLEAGRRAMETNAA